jgi:hypothetical protein
VVKEINSVDDRTKDKVTVRLSERAFGNGSTIKLSTPPASLFRVWERNSLGSFDSLERVLNGIAKLAEVRSDSIIVFYMENGQDLLNSHFMNLNTPAGVVTDAQIPGIPPTADNRKVRVLFGSKPPQRAHVFPSPSPPCLTRVPPGTFFFGNEPLGRIWVFNDNGGTLVSFSVVRPKTGTVSGYMKIYDAIGNIVVKQENKDLLQGADQNVTAPTIDVYWNGTNAMGMMVAPGVYRYVIYLQYDDNQYDTKLFGNIGVSR